MQYQNPQVDESVNVSQEHPLKEFSQLIIGVGLVLLISIIVLSIISEALAKRVPFSFEQKMVERIDYFEPSDSATAKQLQALADRLARHMDLPEEIQLSVHYQESETVNALATLGGNIVFFEGLVEQIESEDELAAVMAHEIAHIKLRHPISALGKGLSITIFATFVSGFSGSTAGDWLISNSAQLTLMNYSRKQESAADLLAAQALQAEYGHIRGAQELFKRFESLEAQQISSKVSVEAFRSHPYSADRWTDISKQAASSGWLTSGDLTPLSLAGQTKKNGQQ